MVIRIPIAMAFGLVAYMLAVLMTMYDGILTMVFQPIVGALVTAVACATMIAVGSPLLLPRVWRVWRRAWVIPPIIIACGLVAMCASWLPPLRVEVIDPESSLQIESFHPVLAIGGWLAMLFGVIYLPRPALSHDGRWL